MNRHRHDRHSQRVISLLLAAGLLATGCRPEPSLPPGLADEQRQARAAARSAKSELKNAERVESEQREEYERLEARLAELDDAEAERQAAYRRAADEHARYQATLEKIESLGQDCLGGNPPNDAKELYQYLASFNSTPERDQAITRLEACRKALVKGSKKDILESAQLLRAAFAEDVEDTFDDNNPYYRGSLNAIVRGDTLLVKMRGTYRGRRRHSQEQVDAWCSKTELFSQITLRNSHGTFTCAPGGSMKEIERSILTDDGLLPPWSPPPPGSAPTPAPAPSIPPPPPGLPEEEHLTQQAATLRADLDAASTEVSRRHDTLNSAESTLSRLDRRAADANQVQRQDLETSARRTQVAGLAIGGLGLLSTSVGAYLVYRRIGVRDELDRAPQFDAFGQATDTSELEAKDDQLTTGIRIGIGVGLPLIATGALLLFLGNQRNDRAKSLALGPGGLVLRF